MQTSDEKRLDSILKILFMMALGNFTYRLELGDEKDQIASIMVLMNILAEEMEARSPYTTSFPDSTNANNIPIMMFCLDGNGNIEGVNGYALLELKLEREHMMGKPFMDFLSEESQKKWNELDDRVSPEGKHPETVVLLDFMMPKGLVLNKFCTVFKTGLGPHTIVGSLNSNHFMEQLWIKSREDRKNGVIRRSNYNYMDIIKIRKAKEYITINLDQKIPAIAVLSSIVGLNEYKLKKGFKELYGASINSFAFQLRLRKAKALIKKSKMPIKAIILDSGFKSISHFYKMFNIKYGMTPSEMRKSYNNP